MQSDPEISVVIPLMNEEENVPDLVSKVRCALEALGRSYEMLFIDDGSTDRTWELLGHARGGDDRIRLEEPPEGRIVAACREVNQAVPTILPLPGKSRPDRRLRDTSITCWEGRSRALLPLVDGAEGRVRRGLDDRARGIRDHIH